MKIDLYADDSTLYESGENISKVEVKLQDGVNNIEKWCKINNMALNPDKSKCMVIGTRQKVNIMRKLYIKINEIVLENVTDQKVLGICIDKNL
jgi:ABC-type uncharacterized transport system ATPase subunit